MDAFLEAKTKALTVLDESNKAKNAAYGIDNTQSATSQFITNLISQKIQAGTASIGPAINSATTFFTSAKSGIAGAFASKFAPLSSLSGGLSGGSGTEILLQYLHYLTKFFLCKYLLLLDTNLDWRNKITCSLFCSLK